jgi:hypothetical protein
MGFGCVRPLQTISNTPALAIGNSSPWFVNRSTVEACTAARVVGRSTAQAFRSQRALGALLAGHRGFKSF